MKYKTIKNGYQHLFSSIVGTRRDFWFSYRRNTIHKIVKSIMRITTRVYLQRFSRFNIKINYTAQRFVTLVTLYAEKQEIIWVIMCACE